MELEQSTIQTLVVVGSLLYGAFLGYCLGRAKGYSEGAKMVEKLYRR